MRIRISYSDQNESLRPLFPVSGSLAEAEIYAADGDHLWHIVELDHPIVSAAGEFGKLLITSRWKGRSVTDPATSVFVLGVPAASADPIGGFDVSMYPRLVWGIVTPE
jgi:hypothetical protein